MNKSEDVAWDGYTQYLAKSSGRLFGYEGVKNPAVSRYLYEDKTAILELIEANGRGNDEYYIRNLFDGGYLTAFYHFSDLRVHFQEDQSKAAVVRLQRYRRDLEPWRRNLKIGSELFIETELIVSGKCERVWHNGKWQKSYKYGYRSRGNCFVRSQWWRAYVIDIKQTGNFEKEIKVEFEYFIYFGGSSFWKKKVYQSEWIVIGSEQIRRRESNDPYFRYYEYPEDILLSKNILPLSCDEDSISKKIYSQRLKTREKQKVERCLPFKDQREMGLKYKRKMKLKAAEIRKKEKVKTKTRSRSQLRKYGLNRRDLC